MDENSQKTFDNIFQAHRLKLSNYEKDNDNRSRDLTKWFNVKNKGEKFAFKSFPYYHDKRRIQNRVKILKEIHDWQNIIRFYGITTDGNSCYLVTEWAEYGNLREFYENNNDSFDLKLKLRVSLDIARGLNFLRTVEVTTKTFYIIEIITWLFTVFIQYA